MFPRFAATAAVGLALAAGGVANAAPIVVGTGPVAAFAFPLGGELCRLFEGAVPEKAQCTVAATDGSVENLKLLRSGDIALAIVQSDVAADAVSATGPFAGGMPFTDLRSIVGFYPQSLTILVRADGAIKQPADLKGQRVSVGVPGQPEQLFTDYLEALGWGKADLGAVVEMPRGEQIAALCDGKIGAIAVTAPHPNGFVREALVAACKITVLDLAGPAIDAVVNTHPAYAPAHLDMTVYGGQQATIQSFGPRAVLVTTAKLEDATVSRLLDGVFHHIDELKKSHPAFAGIDQAGLASAAGLGAERHAAAAKFLTDNKIGDAPNGE